MKGLTGAMEPVDEEAPAGDDSGAAEGVEVCCYDNRGMGRSSVPEQKSQYTCVVHHVSLFLLSSIAGSMFLTMFLGRTAIMAKDALALMDHLGWRKAHVFGHSMGETHFIQPPSLVLLKISQSTSVACLTNCI